MFDLNILYAEFIKSKTFVSLWVHILFPILIVFVVSNGYYVNDLSNIKNHNIVDVIYRDIFLIWSNMFLPIYTIFNVYAVFSVENHTNNWKNVFALGVSRAMIFNHKIVMAILYHIFGSLILSISILLSLYLLSIFKPSVELSLGSCEFPVLLMIFIFFLSSLATIIFYAIVIIMVRNLIVPFITFLFIHVISLILGDRSIHLALPLIYPFKSLNQYLSNDNFTIYLILSVSLFVLGLIIINLTIERTFNRKLL